MAAISNAKTEGVAALDIIIYAMSVNSTNPNLKVIMDYLIIISLFSVE
jgi:hypothetical protein